MREMLSSSRTDQGRSSIDDSQLVESKTVETVTKRQIIRFEVGLVFLFQRKRGDKR
jgi:hypothetical protein